MGDSHADSAMETYDLVIIGAGVHGLAMLKTYHQVNPEASILALDKGSSLGGVWAKDKLYPGLRTNNRFGSLEFSDYPMNTSGFKVAEDHIPGENVNKYLHDYATHFDLLKYMRFNTTVLSALDTGASGWTLSLSTPPHSQPYPLTTSKLVIATGLTSSPLLPHLPGQDLFNAPIHHGSTFAQAENGLGSYKRVAVLRGAKFSWDIAYAYATAGVTVDWIIRASGHGPSWMTPNRLTPFKIIPDYLIQTRFITWLSPCIWDDDVSSIRRFFHRTWLGRKLVDAFFNKMQHGIEAVLQYDSHPETAKLKPWDGIFWVGTNRGLLNYEEDFFALVREGRVRVYIADITRLDDHEVVLSDGTRIHADVLICGTGWKDTPPFCFDTEREVGLPGHVDDVTESYIPRAEAQILTSCPKLKDQPAPRSHTIEPLAEKEEERRKEPYRLYHYMVPPAFIESRTLAFAGAYRSPATTNIAQTQALWLTAYFGNRISSLANLPDKAAMEKVRYETVLHSEWGKWRYPRGFGARFPELFFDSLPYVDLLLKDVGVRARRKGWWWREWFVPYGIGDYRGVVEEWVGLGEGR